MITIHLLALAGYFLCLYEYIAMRHRDICAESDARMAMRFYVDNDYGEIFHGTVCATMAEELYWNRGTK